ncbi:MAG: hypothetical protein H6710_16920 [Myxococcales bacterium]|nr:hypothetical protein [Myxococcales bacterium]MCB9704879.1 hypothetical protein [Myxococcales bacterium]
MIGAAEVEAIAAAARRQPPVADDPRMRALRGARVGAARVIAGPARAPAFWWVPFVVDGLVCGWARVGLDGALGEVAIFGADAEARTSWPPLAFFDAPPAAALAEVAASDAGVTLGEPFLSHDRAPSQIAWRVDVALADGERRVALISPAGWYIRPPA